MKIMLISPAPPPEGGMATWTTNYMRYCRENNINFRLVDTSLIDSSKKNYIQYLINELKRSSKIIFKVLQIVKNDKVNLIHLNSSCSKKGIIRDAFCVLIASIYRIPIIFYCHCNVEDQIGKGLALKILKRILLSVDRVVVINQFSQKFIESITDTTTDIIPNFINKDIIADKHIIREKIENILFVGHIQKSKGFYEINQVAKRFPDKKFCLVGQLNEELVEEEIAENLFFTGVLKFTELEKYYQNADIFLFPSYTEGFSIAMLEAMAFGIPCIATNVGANKDMLGKDGGIIIDKNNVDAIEKSIQYLENPILRQKMSCNNIQKTKEQYEMNNVMNKIINKYKELLKKSC